jgi:hypothetical protein
VRHRQKYCDVPVSEHRAFVFSCERARTLRQFVHGLEALPQRALDAYVSRGDFSRWVADVFGDYALAGELRALEARHRPDGDEETRTDMADAIRARYDLLDEEAVLEPH